MVEDGDAYDSGGAGRTWTRNRSGRVTFEPVKGRGKKKKVQSAFIQHY
jgi:hypothetical protein